MLDRQFHLTFNLTYRTFGGHDRDVNTEPFRSAIWYYTQRLYGVRNDHYDYSLVSQSLSQSAEPSCPVHRYALLNRSFTASSQSYVLACSAALLALCFAIAIRCSAAPRICLQVNKLLPIPTKTFLKKVACFPEIITAADFHGFTTTFTADERVHIVMLVCEARRQAELLYALRAVMRHMTG